MAPHGLSLTGVFDIRADSILRYFVWITVFSFGAMAIQGKQMEVNHSLTIAYGAVGAFFGWLLARTFDGSK